MKKTKGIQHILNCIDCDNDISDRPPNAYLCLNCNKERRRKRDRDRDILRWRKKEERVIGGSYIGEHLYRDKNGKPNFKIERKIIRNEYIRMLKRDFYKEWIVPHKTIPLSITEEEEDITIYIDISSPLSRCERYILMWCEIMRDVITTNDIDEIKPRMLNNGFSLLEIEQAIDDLEDKNIARRCKFNKDIIVYPELVDFGIIEWDDVIST